MTVTERVACSAYMTDDLAVLMITLPS